jgi:restriction endonuclease Mrr
MVLPTNGEIEKQVLLILKDQKVHELPEVKETISKKLNLSKEELNKVSPIKNRLVFDTRVVSSLYQLRKKRFIINEKQGVFKITKEGLNKFKEK